jgi:uncharacterized protein YpmS
MPDVCDNAIHSGVTVGGDSKATMGQQDHGGDGTPASVTVVEADATDPADSSGEATADAESSSPPAEVAGLAEETPRRGPAIPLRLLVLVTILNLGLALALFALRPPGRVERVAAPTAMPPQIEALMTQVQRGEHGAPYQLTLTDDDLTATAGYFLAQSQDVPFSQVRVAVAGGKVEANAVTTGLAVAVPVRVQANIVARNGAPVVEVTDVGVGGMALPSFAHEQVLREANRAVDLSRYNVPVTVDSIELRDGVLEARGAVK